MMTFDPFDWYWRATDARLFSSATSTLVQPSDAAYTAWLAAGNVATLWPADAQGNQTTASLQDVLAPYGLFADLKAYAAAVRYAKEVGGTVVNGVAYPSDRDTQAKMTAAALFAQVDNTQTFKWKLADGSFTAALTAPQMIAVAAAVGGFVNACFATEQTVDAAIDGGSIISRAQVDAAFA